MKQNVQAKAGKKAVTSSGKIRFMTQVGMLSALAAVLMLIEVPLPFLAPPFYKLDLSELPVLIGAMAMGPLAGVVIEFIKILIHLVMKGSQTAMVGEVANFIIGCSLVVPASVIYKMKKTRKRAVIGMMTGTVFMAFVGCFLNALVLLPAYAKAFGAPIETFIEMGSAINPNINGVWSFVFIAVAPFNIVKGFVVSLATLLLYKHISRLLKEQ
ncbi:MAG TPA: ECF transporter S component [Lachnospiraceae bacterium]